VARICARLKGGGPGGNDFGLPINNRPDPGVPVLGHFGSLHRIRPIDIPPLAIPPKAVQRPTLLGEVRQRQAGTCIPEMLNLNGGLPGCDALASFPGAEESSVPTAIVGGQKALYRTPLTMSSLATSSPVSASTFAYLIR
jgi:hypothetical protein